jgi:hypothetical protein
MSDMACNAARVAVERSGKLPRYKAEKRNNEKRKKRCCYVFGRGSNSIGGLCNLEARSEAGL